MLSGVALIAPVRQKYPASHSPVGVSRPSEIETKVKVKSGSVRRHKKTNRTLD